MATRVIEPFQKQHHSRENFSCEVESLQQYFRTQASQDVRKKVAAVFVLAEGAAVLGYYTLSSYAIDTGDLPPDVARRLPGYPKLPAILIGRLARDQKYRGQRIGETLLMDALHRCLENTATAGAIAVVVEAENEKARNFYLEYGFVAFPDHRNKLFITMQSVKAMFAP
ncbi:MAG TPA: GNAT family N-acetyltransferase [Bryobacteraceae bacterium]|nr:GNAT family N-acetyltransferase [Bryobacteraceae bacterium]